MNTSEIDLDKIDGEGFPDEERKERSFFVTKPGYKWNPLLKLPRNAPCPCGSGVKFKNCHAGKLPHTIKESEFTNAKLFLEQWGKKHGRSIR